MMGTTASYGTTVESTVKSPISTEKYFHTRFCLPSAVIRCVYVSVNVKHLFVRRIQATGRP